MIHIVFLIINIQDARHPDQKSDEAFHQYISYCNNETLLSFNKIDKLKKQKEKSALNKKKKEIFQKYTWVKQIFFTSAQSKENIRPLHDTLVNFILRKKHKLTNHLPHEAIDKKYIAQINKIKSSKSFIFDRTNSNIFDLIKSSNICISFPYSSTAILARELGKPSIYYDPSNQIDKYNKKFSHGIHVINNFDTLDEWIGQNLS